MCYVIVCVNALPTNPEITTNWYKSSRFDFGEVQEKIMSSAPSTLVQGRCVCNINLFKKSLFGLRWSFYRKNKDCLMEFESKWRFNKKASQISYSNLEGFLGVEGNDFLGVEKKKKKPP